MRKLILRFLFKKIKFLLAQVEMLLHMQRSGANFRGFPFFVEAHQQTAPVGYGIIRGNSQCNLVGGNCQFQGESCAFCRGFKLPLNYSKFISDSGFYIAQNLYIPTATFPDFSFVLASMHKLVLKHRKYSGFQDNYYGYTVCYESKVKAAILCILILS